MKICHIWVYVLKLNVTFLLLTTNTALCWSPAKADKRADAVALTQLVFGARVEKLSIVADVIIFYFFFSFR